MPAKSNLKRSRSSATKKRAAKVHTRTTKSRAKVTKPKRSSTVSRRKPSKRKSLLRLRWAKVTSMVLAVVVVGGLFLAHDLTKADTINGQPIGIASGAVNGQGYWILGKDGGVFTEGSAHFYGAGVGNIHSSNYNFVGMASVPIVATTASTITGYSGYYLVDQDGHVYAYSAHYYGGVNETGAGNIAGIATNPNGTGYWILGRDGTVYHYGSVPSFSKASSAEDFVGISATPDGKGYWLVDTSGHVFSYGDAHYHGGVAGTSNVVGIASDATGGGYWIASANGGVFTFGDAHFSGSMGGKALAKPIVAITATSNGGGYWLLGGDGGLFTFGNATYSGRVQYNPSAPVISSCSSNVTNNFTVNVTSCKYQVTQPGATITGVYVNWGGSNNSSSLPASFKYPGAGPYTVKVTVTDSNNQTSGVKVISGTLVAPTPVQPGSCTTTHSCPPGSCTTNHSCPPGSCTTTNSCTKTITTKQLLKSAEQVLATINGNIGMFSSQMSNAQAQYNALEQMCSRARNRCTNSDLNKLNSLQSQVAFDQNALQYWNAAKDIETSYTKALAQELVKAVTHQPSGTSNINLSRIRREP